MPKKSSLPPNVTEFRDRHGAWRLRFRKRGQPTYYFKHKPGTDEFRAELEDCRKATPAPRGEKIAERCKPGSMSALIATYYGSPEFTGLKASTRATYRGILERFRRDFGDLPVATLTRQNVKDILGAMADRPAAANNLLDRLKALMTFAIDGEWRETDPTMRVKGFKLNSEGFHTWTEDEIAQFERRHPSGTKPRLALALLLYCGQRRSDTVPMGRQHLDGRDRIKVRQQKTGAFLSIPRHPALNKELATVPAGQMTFILTEYRKPFTAAGFGGWFRTQCDLAGLPQCSAHGLRKAAARRLAEAGCTHEEIKSITGHKTDREVTRYVAAANQRTLSDQAMKKVRGTKSRTTVG